MSRARVVLPLLSVLLLVPSAAHAATATPGTLQAAVDGADAGETITLAAGDYAEAVTIPAAKTGLVFDGSAGARLTGPLTVQATGTTLRTLAVAPTTGGISVAVNGAAILDRVLVTDTGDEAAPIVAAGGLTLTDSTVVTTKGPALTLTGTPTSIVRSTVATTQASSDAVNLAVNTAGTFTLTSDSSIFIGGATGGAGVRAATSGVSTPPLFTVGSVTVALRHATVAGAGGVVVASGASLAGGAIAATVNGSIVHPPSTATSSQLGGGAATLAFADSDAPGQPLSFTDAQVFGKNLRLRADAPVIGKGGPLADGESQTDIDGNPRTAPVDGGADQFVNGAPTTGLTVTPGVVNEGTAISAALTPSDPDAGDSIPVYAFDWGDGTKTVGAAPTATHSYAKPGVYAVKGAVADARNTPSNVATAAVTVKDVSAPAIAVKAPKNGAKLKYKRSRRLTIKGSDTDSTSVGKVEIAITRTVGKRCFQYGTKRFKKGKCSKFSWRRATLRDTSFSLRTRKGVKLTRGSYSVRIRATDGIGNVTKGFTVKRGTLVRFKVR